MAKYVLIPDSFKGTLSSEDICRIASEEILRLEPEAEICAIPVADGGEGTVDAFLAAVGGTRAERLPPAIMPAKCSSRSMGLRMRPATRRPMRAESSSAPRRISTSRTAERMTTRVIRRLLCADRLISAEM